MNSIESISHEMGQMSFSQPVHTHRARSQPSCSKRGGIPYPSNPNYSMDPMACSPREMNGSPPNLTNNTNTNYAVSSLPSGRPALTMAHSAEPIPSSTSRPSHPSHPSRYHSTSSNVAPMHDSRRSVKPQPQAGRAPLPPMLMQPVPVPPNSAYYAINNGSASSHRPWSGQSGSSISSHSQISSTSHCQTHHHSQQHSNSHPHSYSQSNAQSVSHSASPAAPPHPQRAGARSGARSGARAGARGQSNSYPPAQRPTSVTQRPGHNVISHGVRHHHPNHQMTNHHHTNHLHHSHHHGAGQHDQRHMMQMDRNPVREPMDRNYGRNRIETQCQITEQERQQLEQQRLQQERAHERATLAKQQERAKRQHQFAAMQREERRQQDFRHQLVQREILALHHQKEEEKKRAEGSTSTSGRDMSTSGTTTTSSSTLSASLSSKTTPSVLAGDLLKKYRIENESFRLWSYYKPISKKLLGRGGYGVVMEAMDLRNGQKVAIKKMKNVFAHLNTAKCSLRELALMMHFDHRNIIDVVDCMLPEPRNEDIYQQVCSSTFF